MPIYQNLLTYGLVLVWPSQLELQSNFQPVAVSTNPVLHRPIHSYGLVGELHPASSEIYCCIYTKPFSYGRQGQNRENLKKLKLLNTSIEVREKRGTRRRRVAVPRVPRSIEYSPFTQQPFPAVPEGLDHRFPQFPEVQGSLHIG